MSGRARGQALKHIWAFAGPHRFLSNFFSSKVTLDGVEYPTVEHAFQAAKTLSPAIREVVRSRSTPAGAKRAGRAIHHTDFRAEWDSIRIEVMRGLLREKFRDPELASKLLETGDAELVEGNDWGDRFWGICRGEGENHLGKLLMEIRAELRERTS